MLREQDCFLHYSCVGDLILPCYAQDASEASKVEVFHAVLLSGIDRPGFTAMEIARN